MVTTGPIAESPQASQVEGRAVVGRRVRDLVLLHGRDDLVRAQRAAAVLVDQFEAAPGRREELAREFCDFFLSALGVGLALRCARGELVVQRDFDAFLPA